jgi:hypothetical protein
MKLQAKVMPDQQPSIDHLIGIYRHANPPCDPQVVVDAVGYGKTPRTTRKLGGGWYQQNKWDVRQLPLARTTRRWLDRIDHSAHPAAQSSITSVFTHDQHPGQELTLAYLHRTFSSKPGRLGYIVSLLGRHRSTYPTAGAAPKHSSSNCHALPPRRPPFSAEADSAMKWSDVGRLCFIMHLMAKNICSHYIWTLTMILMALNYPS